LRHSVVYGQSRSLIQECEICP